MKVQMLIIDAQNDFTDIEGAAMGVPGALADAQRLEQLINKKSATINDIIVTLDTHQQLDIAHPMAWTNSRGESPEPFTIISVDDVSNGTWRAYHPAFQQRFQAYVEALHNNKRYQLCIWPPHTLLGSWGHNIVAPVYKAITEWEKQQKARFNVITKGHNPFTEQYSILMSDVPDPLDINTQLNSQLLESLEQADLILIAGQALSHCVANSVCDIADNFRQESISKLVLLEDTSSPVPGFEDLADDFLRDMKSRGMQTAKTSELEL